jgi:hypothetical protein
MSAVTVAFACIRALQEVVSTREFEQSPYMDVPVQTTIGLDGERLIESAIIIGLVSPTSEGWVTFGPGSKSEEFGILLALDTSAPHPTPQDALDRLEHLVHLVESEIATRRLPSVNGSVLNGVTHWFVDSMQLAWAPNPDRQGYGASADLIVRVKARNR